MVSAEGGVLGYNEPDMIRLYHLTKSYPNGPLVFQEAYFSAPDRAFAVLCGGNRSGKSTLLRLLCGEETPTSGLVLVRGRRIHEMDAAERRDYLREAGLVFPDMGLLWERTVGENLLLPLHLREEFESEARDRALRILSRLGLKGAEGKKPADLSFGEQRTVVFARALVSRPKLLLLDEPFQGMDDALVASCLDLLAEANAGGATVVLGMQDPAAVARYAKAHPDLRIVWGRFADRGIQPMEAPSC